MNHTNTLLDKGWYETPSESIYWANPVQAVRKKDIGSDAFRVVVDHRALKDKTEPMQQSHSLIEEEILKLSSSSIYGVFDFFKGYPQIAISKCSRKYFCIRRPDGS